MTGGAGPSSVSAEAGFWPWSRDADEPALSEKSSQALVGHWNAMLRQLRPESAELFDSVSIRIVSRKEIKKKTGRDSDGHYDWGDREVLINGGLLAELREKVAAEVGEAGADLSLAALYLHVLDHEVAGHAGAVDKMRKAHGRYTGMVMEEELFSYITEAEGLARCYDDPSCSRALAKVKGLADERHQEILQAVPQGVEGFEELIRRKGYTLPTARAKAREYLDTAAEIEARLQERGSAAVEMRRASAADLTAFYETERRRLAGLLESLRDR